MTFWMPKPGMMAAGGGGGLGELVYPPVIRSQRIAQLAGVNFTVPATVEAGDYLVVAFKSEASVDFPNTDVVGWDKIGHAGSTSNDRAIAVHGKVADGSEANTVLAATNMIANQYYGCYVIEGNGHGLVGNTNTVVSVPSAPAQVAMVHTAGHLGIAIVQWGRVETLGSTVDGVKLDSTGIAGTTFGLYYKANGLAASGNLTLGATNTNVVISGGACAFELGVP